MIPVEIGSGILASFCRGFESSRVRLLYQKQKNKKNYQKTPNHFPMLLLEIPAKFPHLLPADFV